MKMVKDLERKIHGKWLKSLFVQPRKEQAEGRPRGSLHCT